MSWFEGFPFKTRAQMEKERKQFQSRVLPLGEPQKQAALLVLQQVVSAKVPDSERLFAFFAAKDKYLEGLEDEEEAPKAAMQAIKKQPGLTLQDKLNIVALIHLEHAISTLEEYPTAGQVLAAALQFEDLA